MKPKITLLPNIRLATKIGLASAAAFAFSWPAEAQNNEKPNILWITSEDNSARHMGCYGNEQATTPNIDELSEEGVTYNNAFANAPVCAPARFTIISGMYASNPGTQHMRSNNKIPNSFRFFPEYLREAGYYTTNNSKEDYNLDRDQWNKNVEEAWNESSGSAHYKNRKEGQPFFAVFNTTLSHEHKIHYHLQQENFEHDPNNLDIAPYHPDVPEMRKNYAQYYDYISRMDQRVGEILDELEERGLAKNTIVFYYGDHGGVLPRSKRFVFESGTRVPMIVRFPEKYEHLAPGEPGSRKNRLVSFVDLAPTVLSLAGVDIPENMQGHAFLGNQKTEDPEYVHFFRGRMDERYDMMRSVRTENYRYIRNYMPHRIYGQHLWYLWRSTATRVWQEAYRNGETNAIQSRFWETKPTEELYHVKEDPHNVNNLANDPEYQDVLKRMRKETQRWVRENRGAGFMPEAMMKQLAEDGTIYEMTHSQDFPTDKIISTAEMASRKDPADVPELIEKMSADHPAIRYWAATGCAVRGEGAREAAPQLKQMLEDDYGNNRIAAAEALCRMDFTEESLQLLVDEMNNDNEWVQLHALNVLESLDPQTVEPVQQEIFSVATWKERSGYFRRAYKSLLKKLKPGWSDYVIW
jgi:arylsulfatase A-like enzyme